MTYAPVHSWAARVFRARHFIDGGVADIEAEHDGRGAHPLASGFTLRPTARSASKFEWSSADFTAGDWFTTELSFSQFPPVVASDSAEPIWWYPIETVAKSERGLDRTRQGMAALIRWPVALGRGTLQIR